MKNVEGSEWLREPGLSVIEAITMNDVRRSEFTVTANQIRTEGEDEFEEAEL